MKVIFTGGGSGGHFYPTIAIAEKLNELALKEKILDTKFYYISDSAYDQKALDDNKIEFIKLDTGKNRLYFSIANFFDVFKTFFATWRAVWIVYKIYPDVIFSKGGYPAVPVTIAAKVLNIPLILHESDSVPGRANKLASKWAKRIAISFKESADFLPKDKTIYVGHIVRKEVREPLLDGAYEYLKLKSNLPIIFILGGSQGAKKINEAVLQALPDLVPKYQVIHQVGTKNFEYINNIKDVILKDNVNSDNYYPYPYLNKLAMRMAAGVSTLVISRAGANSIAEIASWGLPSIIIPITKSNGNHQIKNAFNYARTGAADVLEEGNLEPHVLVAEIIRITNDENLMQKMKEATKEFVTLGAEEKIAQEIINISIEHEK